MLTRSLFSKAGMVFVTTVIFGFALVIQTYYGLFTSDYYFPQFVLYIWAPQVAVLAVLLFFHPKMIFLTGVSLAMDIYMALLAHFTLYTGKFSFWITYLTSFLGVVLGAYAGLVLLSSLKNQSWVGVFLIGFASTWVGVITGFISVVKL